MNDPVDLRAGKLYSALGETGDQVSAVVCIPWAAVSSASRQL